MTSESSRAPPGIQGHTAAPQNHDGDVGTSPPASRGKRKRRQLSGAAKRQRARAKAAAAAGEHVVGVVLPPVPSEQDLQSLTGTARESARCYREWRFGRISYADYLVAIRGLGTHKDILTAVETHERTRQELEALREQLSRLDGSHTAPLMLEGPTDATLASLPAPAADDPAADGLDPDAALDAALDTAAEVGS